MGRPFDFPRKVTRLAWFLSRRVPGRDLKRWKSDTQGVSVLHPLRSKYLGLASYVFDHKFAPITELQKRHPFFRSIKNCHVLSTKVNLAKSDKNNVTREELMKHVHNLEITEACKDLLELCMYGNVKNEKGDIQHECYTVGETRSGIPNTHLPSRSPMQKTNFLTERFPQSYYDESSSTKDENGVEDQSKMVEQCTGHQLRTSTDGYADEDQEASRENVGFSAGYPQWDDTNLQSSPVSQKSTEHATINDMPSGSEILPSEIFPPNGSEILPTNILRMLVPPQNVPPSTEEKEMKVKKDTDWSFACCSCSADSSGGQCATTGGAIGDGTDNENDFDTKSENVLQQQEKATYPQRPGEPECSHYMKHGYCKFQKSCIFHHPTDRL